MIKSITIQIGRKEVELSPEDAKALYNSLHEIFGVKLCNLAHINWPYSQPYTPSGTWVLNGVTAGDVSTTTGTVYSGSSDPMKWNKRLQNMIATSQ